MCLTNRPNYREIDKLQKFFDFLTFICNFLKPYPGDKFPDPRMQASGPLVGYLNILNPNPGKPVWYRNLPNPNPNLIPINYTKYKTKFL